MSLLQQQLDPARLRTLLTTLRWYHSFEFPGGLSVQGSFDLAPTIPYYGFPASLKGKRVLDIGTSDGYLAFEAERRGGSVTGMDTLAYDGTVAIDPSPAFRDAYEKKYAGDRVMTEQFPDVLKILNIPTLNRFYIARDLLGLKADYRNGSIYDLKASGETYDVIICGALIEHLKNPLEAAENLAAATGEMCIITLSNALKPSTRLIDRVRRRLANTLMPAGEHVPQNQLVAYTGNVSGGSFFHFHPQAFRQVLLASGFKRVEIHSFYEILSVKAQQTVPHAVLHAYR